MPRLRGGLQHPTGEVGLDLLRRFQDAGYGVLDRFKPPDPYGPHEPAGQRFGRELREGAMDVGSVLADATVNLPTDLAGLAGTVATGQPAWGQSVSPPIKERADRARSENPYTTAWDLAAPGPAEWKLAAIKAFHGSPHLFKKFSMDKIGTGEGAQAYGHGLYFAESPGVAEDYLRSFQRNLDRGFDRTAYTVSRDPISESGEWLVDSDQLRSEVTTSGALDHRMIGEEVDRRFPTKEAAEKWIDENVSGGLSAHERAPVDPQYPEFGDRFTPKAIMYQTTLDVDPEDLLDWDAPLSEQSPKVRGLLAEVRSQGADLDTMSHDDLIAYAERVDPNGSWSDEALAYEYGEDPKTFRQDTEELRDAVKNMMSDAPEYMQGGKVFTEKDFGAGNYDAFGRSVIKRLEAEDQPGLAARRLREAGIPGLRYKDAMSRDTYPYRVVRDGRNYDFDTKEGAEAFASAEEAVQRITTPDPTRNIVMFDEDKIAIDKINDEPLSKYFPEEGPLAPPKRRKR
jgi:hypothetical protein